MTLFPRATHLTPYTKIQTKLSYLESQSSRWPKWFPEPEYATSYLNFKYSSELPDFLGKLFSWLSHNPRLAAVENGPIAPETEEEEKGKKEPQKDGKRNKKRQKERENWMEAENE